MTISDLAQFPDFIKLMFHLCVHTSAWKKRRLIELNINFDCGIIRFLVLQLVDGLNNVPKDVMAQTSGNPTFTCVLKKNVYCSGKIH